MVAPFWRRAPLMHPISGPEILPHSDRVAAWILARCGVPNFRMKIELCVNAVDVPANITTDTTNPNHLDTAFLPSLSPPRSYSYRRKSGFSKAVKIFKRFKMLSIFKRHFAFSGTLWNPVWRYHGED